MAEGVEMFPRRVVLLAILAALIWAAASLANDGHASRAAKLTRPVITESFTPLPCAGKPNSRTTLQQEGCAEHQILITDARINALGKAIFRKLPDDRARRRFVASSLAWLTYRRADCLSRADVFEGGSQAPVIYAQCMASRNTQRINDLRTFLRELGG
jgi:uncharacterized protein YecT (DUF1311 family)